MGKKGAEGGDWIEVCLVTKGFAFRVTTMAKLGTSASPQTRFTTLKLRNTTGSEAQGDAEVLERAVPFIPDRLYFATRRRKPASTPETHFFSTDEIYVYMSYNDDFGPLNLAMLTKYCRKINRKLKV